ncbi:MAG: hypothetical protein A2X59_03465 [Nitrospirae bacterium GWC2_42_7]|nr:MAG: hypothetical protein A2X59_03465 [Nitrospirae bacterium GWC2_42_7]
MKFKRYKGMFLCALFYLFAVLLNLNTAVAQEQPMETVSPDQIDPIKIISPAENSQVIGKKPEIKLEFPGTIDTSTVVVIIDGTDVTEIASVTEKGFEYTPVIALPAGQHTILVLALGKDGIQIQKQFAFISRHSEAFDEAYSNNEVSVIYESAIMKPERAINVPYSKIEGNLISGSKLRNEHWEFSLTSGLRYFDQSLPVYGVSSPGQASLSKGLDLLNFLFTGKYTNNDTKFITELGDIQITETQNTVSGLARRGGKVSLEYKNFSLNAFDVRSRQAIGFIGGLGIEGKSKEHISGISGGIKLFDKKLELRTIYASGGEPGNSVGITTTSSHSKGNVMGLLLRTDFFENRLITEAEYDYVTYDPDTSDNYKKQSDRTYRLKAGGTLNKYTYEVIYEYYGPNYTVIGNTGTPRDRKGVNILNSLNLGDQAITLMLSKYSDNIGGNPLLLRTNTYIARLDYALNKLPSLPMMVSYEKSIQDSTKEPSNTEPLNIYSDTITGAVTYVYDQISIGFASAYSIQNDRTEANNDTKAVSFSLTPSYNIPGLSLIPAFVWSRSWNSFADVWTDMYTSTLGMNSRFFRDRVSFDINGTYLITKADDNSVNTKNLNANFRLGYNMQNIFSFLKDPVVALRGNYQSIKDKINPDVYKDETTLFLVFSTAIPFSF